MYILEVSRGCPNEKYPLYGIFEMDQAKALKSAGHKVIFAAVDVRSVRRRRRFGIFKTIKDGITVYNFSFPVGAIRGADKAFARWGFEQLMKRIIAEYGKPDIVHAHFSGMAACVRQCCIKENIPYVVTEHSSSVNKEELPDKFKAELCESYKNAAAVVAVSEALREKIEKHTGVKAQVIPNIVDFSAFKTFNRSENKMRFLSAGNLKESKGFDVLIRAFAKVHEKRPDSKLLIMGGGSEEDMLRKLAEEENLADVVEFSGAFQREDFAKELKESDVFVLASRSETFGVVYAEAMAAGRPVIATRCGGPEDFVNEKCGKLVDVDDVAALSKTMLEVGECSSEFDSSYISSYVRSRFSADTIAAHLSALFSSVISKA